MNKTILQHTFSNGLRLIYLPWNTTVAHAGVFVAAGSRNETEKEQGLAHFIEHTIFKGTSRRSSAEILKRLESVGGELNAYTEREETAIYASFLPQYSFRALDLLSDVIFNAVFPEKELEKEKEVVIDEIDSYLDTPSEQIFDDFEEYIFPNQPFGKNILGTPEKVRSFTQQQILHFTQNLYQPERIVVSYVGKVPFRTILNYVERLFDRPNLIKEHKIQPALHSKKFDLTIQKPIHQAHCILGGIAPCIASNDRFTMSLLNNYLGGPAMSSLLNMVLREKNGFTYNNESHYSAYSDTGIFQIYLGTEKRNLKKCLRLIAKELDKLCKKPLSTTFLHKIQKQYCGQIAIASDSGLNQMISIGKSLLHTGTVIEMEEMFVKIENISSSHIMDVANQYLHFDKLSILSYISE
ncbi:MAG: insulinase family protein [Bacteroidales bacterium]|jgi:predicted Zn-dependent peptidase|nr:insulinase family protein [Bacteroidales bacterium]